MLQKNAQLHEPFSPKSYDTFSSLAEAFLSTVSTKPNAVAYYQSNLANENLSSNGASRRWVPTLNEVCLDRVEKIAAYLESVGVKNGDRVMILSNTRPEWSEAEMAIYRVGATLVTGYTTSLYDKVGYTIVDSEADVVFVENSGELEKVLKACSTPFKIDKNEVREERQGVASVRNIISFESDNVLPNSKVETLSRILSGEATPQIDLSNGPLQAVMPTRDEIATIIYTSGTTGAPKGVMATHGQHLANLRQVMESGLFTSSDKMMHVLPFAHAFGIRMGHMTLLSEGAGCFTAITDRNSSKMSAAAGIAIGKDLATGQAQFLPVVPKMLERFKVEITRKLEKEEGWRGRLARFAVDLYSQKVAAEVEEKPLGFLKRAALFALDVSGVGPSIKQRIHKGMAGDEFKAFISGGGALPKESAYFFWGLDIPIYEGYGATECNTPVTFNLPNATRLGSTGRRLASDIELKIAETGEVLVRGPNIALGYLGYPKASSETFDSEGWYHTRDQGEIKEGYLYIGGRLDDVEVPESGENIRAVDVEDKIRNIPLVEDVVFVAHKRPYPVALVSIDRVELKKIAPQLADVDVTKSPEVKALVLQQIQERFNIPLAQPFERVKDIAIIPNLEVGKDLTATLKVQRKKVKLDNAALIDSLYIK